MKIIWIKFKEWLKMFTEHPPTEAEIDAKIKKAISDNWRNNFMKK